MTTAMDLNLDGMSHVELVQFASRFVGNGVRPVRAARELFPNHPKGSVLATKALRNYAWNKATAMTCRQDGRIDEAIVYEGICDRIYQDLPEWAKGW